MKRMLYSLLVATLPFGNVLADASPVSGFSLCAVGRR
jgi:hypothetical protein